MTELNIKIEFKVAYVDVIPRIKIFSSIDAFEIDIDHSGIFQFQLLFNEQCQLGVEFLNKDDYEDNWIEIVQISIDNINLQHFIFKGKFYPIYNQDWYQAQNPKPPDFYCPGTQMRHKGIWVLPITIPIFKTVLNQWLYDER